MSANRRDHLVQTALDLFHKNGYRGTGVEKILATAGVSKPTLYRHFNSKDELIIAALDKWDEDTRAWLRQEMETRGETPRDQVLALFDALADWFEDVGFHGCILNNATVEFAERDNPIHQAAASHKRKFAELVRHLVAAADVMDPDEVTAELMIIMEGAIITAHGQERSGAALRARAIAESVLDHAIREPCAG